MSFLPDPSVLLAYSLACFVLFVTPGPDMSFFLSKTVSGGRRAGMAAMFGALTGCCVHTLVAAFGLSAVLAASATAFTAVKIAGAVYLLWLAYDAIRRGSALNVRDGGARKEPLQRTFLLGVGINLLNPKIVLFFVTFLPQFIDARDPNASGKLVFLGLYFVVFCIPLAVSLILAAEKVIAGLKGKPRVMRALDFGFAGVFGAFAVKILGTQGR